MRLLTYNRGGARRLGAWVQDAVVDLPEAVGHPAFPTTMEALVARNGGTTLDAARTALSQPGVVEEFHVPGARLLAPFEPRWSGSAIVGPEEEVRLKRQGAAEVTTGLACILRRGGRDLSLEEAGGAIFGYTLFARFEGGAMPEPILAAGPHVVSPEEIQGRDLQFEMRFSGEGVLSLASLAEGARSMAKRICSVSRERAVGAGDVFAVRAGRSVSLDIPRLGRGARLQVDERALGLLEVPLRFA